jgi:ankyrin repeat protein
VSKKTALHIAVINHLKEECALIIKHGANVNLMDERHWTPLYYAMASCNPDLVNLLLDNGAFVHESDHGRVLLSRIIDSATFQEGYFLQRRLISVVTSIIQAGTDTTGIDFTEDFKRKFPAVVDALNKSSERSINEDAVHLTPPFATLQDNAAGIEQTDVILKEYRGNTNNQHKSRYTCKLTRTLIAVPILNLNDVDNIQKDFNARRGG